MAKETYLITPMKDDRFFFGPGQLETLEVLLREAGREISSSERQIIVDLTAEEADEFGLAFFALDIVRRDTDPSLIPG